MNDSDISATTRGEDRLETLGRRLAAVRSALETLGGVSLEEAARLDAMAARLAGLRGLTHADGSPGGAGAPGTTVGAATGPDAPDAGETVDEPGAGAFASPEAHAAYLGKWAGRLKRRTVNFALAMPSNDPGEMRLAFHPKKAGRGLAAMLKKAAGAKKFTFGRAGTSALAQELGVEDGGPRTLLLALEGRNIPGLQKRVRLMLKSMNMAQFSRVQVISAGAEGEPASEVAEADAGGAAGRGTTDGPAPTLGATRAAAAAARAGPAAAAAIAAAAPAIAAIPETAALAFPEVPDRAAQEAEFDTLLGALKDHLARMAPDERAAIDEICAAFGNAMAAGDLAEASEMLLALRQQALLLGPAPAVLPAEVAAELNAVEPALLERALQPEEIAGWPAARVDAATEALQHGICHAEPDSPGYRILERNLGAVEARRVASWERQDAALSETLTRERLDAMSREELDGALHAIDAAGDPRDPGQQANREALLREIAERRSIEVVEGPLDEARALDLATALTSDIEPKAKALEVLLHLPDLPPDLRAEIEDVKRRIDANLAARSARIGQIAQAMEPAATEIATADLERLAGRIPAELVDQFRDQLASQAGFMVGFAEGYGAEVPLGGVAHKPIQNPLTFQLYLTGGTFAGMWAGLKDLVDTVVMLGGTAAKLVPYVANPFKLPMEAFQFTSGQALEIIRDHEAWLAERQAEAEKVMTILEAVKAAHDDFDANAYASGSAMGKAVGRIMANAEQYFADMPETEKAWMIGKVAGAIGLEIIIEALLAVATEGIGNVARAGLLVAQGIRKSAKFARLLEDAVRQVPMIRKFLGAIGKADLLDDGAGVSRKLDELAAKVEDIVARRGTGLPDAPDGPQAPGGPAARDPDAPPGPNGEAPPPPPPDQPLAREPDVPDGDAPPPPQGGDAPPPPPPPPPDGPAGGGGRDGGSPGDPDGPDGPDGHEHDGGGPEGSGPGRRGPDPTDPDALPEPTPEAAIALKGEIERISGRQVSSRDALRILTAARQRGMSRLDLDTDLEDWRNFEWSVDEFLKHLSDPPSGRPLPDADIPERPPVPRAEGTVQASPGARVLNPTGSPRAVSGHPHVMDDQTARLLRGHDAEAAGEMIAGTGGIQRIEARELNPGSNDGALGIEIEGEVLPGRLNRRGGRNKSGQTKAPNFNARKNDFFKRSEMGFSRPESWELSHLWGPGFGDEAAAGMYWAPTELNQLWQRQFLEDQIIELARRVAPHRPQFKLSLIARVETWPRPTPKDFSPKGALFVRKLRYEVILDTPSGPRRAAIEVDIRTDPGDIDRLGADPGISVPTLQEVTAELDELAAQIPNSID